jgi:hypothetical protein
MSVCTVTVTAKPPKVERPSSSARITLPSVFMLLPPYSSG